MFSSLFRGDGGDVNVMLIYIVLLGFSNAWRYHAVIIGGSLVLSFWATVVVLGMWIRKMLKGTLGR